MCVCVCVCVCARVRAHAHALAHVHSFGFVAQHLWVSAAKRLIDFKEVWERKFDVLSL